MSLTKFWVLFFYFFIECFTTTFLRAHSWLNWVDDQVLGDGDNVLDEMMVF